MADIKIYGKLVNDTTSGILAGTNQLYDSTAGKFQDAINEEQRVSLSELLQTAVKGLSLEEVADGYNLLLKLYDGKTIDSGLKVDRTPTKDSTNFVTSGGVQAAIGALTVSLSDLQEKVNNLSSSGGGDGTGIPLSVLYTAGAATGYLEIIRQNTTSITASLPVATTSTAGLMSAEDYNALRWQEAVDDA